jgi:Na+/proline symporter
VDAKQMLLMFAGIFVAVGLLLARLPAAFSFTDAVHLAGVTRRWNNIDLSPDLTSSYTLLSGMLGGFFLALSYFGCDQSQVQRYLTGRSISESRLSLIFNAFVKVPMQFLILAIGVLMFVFYHFEKPPLNFNESYRQLLVARAPAEYAELEKRHEAAFERRRQAAIELEQARRAGGDCEAEERRYLAAQETLQNVGESNRLLLSKTLGALPSAEVNYVFPSFLLQYAPAGVLGIMIAVIFAAAMSTFSSEINSLASASVIDFYKRYFVPEAPDRHYLLVSRGATVLWGLFATTAAVFAGRLGSLIEAVNKVGSYFYGPILGVFLLAFFARRSNATGAFWGLLAGEVSVLAVAYYSSISWLYYNVVGAAAVVLAGLLISRTSPAADSQPGMRE